MGNLIKMDLKRMSSSTLFIVSLIIVAVFNILFDGLLPIIFNIIPNLPKQAPATIDSILSSPFSISFVTILLFMSVVSFFYADIANGFIKNLAGQVPKRSNLLISKFTVIGIHNLIFVVVGTISRLLGVLLAMACGVTFTSGKVIFGDILTVLIKWMLCMAISAILLFITTGVKNKTFASIFGVIIGTGSLGLVYFGLTSAMNTLFRLKNFSIGDYMPDQLFNSVNVGSNIAVVNAVLVSIICSAIFLALTIRVFNKTDIK